MANMHVHPGVYVNIQDLTSYVQELPGTIAFIPFLSEKGEDNKLIFTGSKSLIAEFGTPNMKKYRQGLYNAINYHKFSTWLYVMRVLPVSDDVNDNETYSSGEKIVYTIPTSEDSGITLSVDKDLVDKNPETQKLVPKKYPSATFANLIYGVYKLTLKTDNSDLSSIDIEFPGFAHAVQPYFKDDNYSLGFTEWLFAFQKSSTYTSFNDEIVYYNPLKTGAYEGFPKFDGEDDKNFSNLSITWDNFKDNDESTKGNILKKIEETIGLEIGYENNLSDEDTITEINIHFTPVIYFYGKGRGEWYNKIGITLSKSNADPDKYIFTIYEIDESSGTSKVIDGSPYTVSFDPESVDETGESDYIAFVVEKYSSHLQVYVNEQYYESIQKQTFKVCHYGESNISEKNFFDAIASITCYLDPETNLYTLGEKTLKLKGGCEGVLYDREDKTLNNTKFTSIMVKAYSGEYDKSILDYLNNDISLVFDSGLSSDVKKEIINLCQRRNDCFGVLDLADVINVDTAINSRKELGNAWHAAAYMPYSKVYSEYEGKYIKVAPSYHLSYVYPRNDSLFSLYDAPAGLKRASLSLSPEDLEFIVCDGAEFDRVYLNQINPIRVINGTVCVDGNLTLKEKPSALQNINVARTLLYIVRVLRRYSQYFRYDRIVPLTLRTLQADIQELLKEIRNENGIQNATVVVHSTPYEQRKKIINVDISITPTYVAEKIQLNFKLV